MSDRIAQSDPAEGSREVIERELARQDRRERSKRRKSKQEEGGGLTHRSILAALRDADDHLVAEIVETGASLEEFGEAVSWITDDEAMREAGAAAPSGRIARLIDLLCAAEEARVGIVGDEP